MQNDIELEKRNGVRKGTELSTRCASAANDETKRHTTCRLPTLKEEGSISAMENRVHGTCGEGVGGRSAEVQDGPGIRSQGLANSSWSDEPDK